MDHFCTSVLWDPDLTWNTTTPLFTSCFLKTVLIWVPVAVFWIFMPAEAVFIARSKKESIPWLPLNVTKTIIVVILIIASVIEMSIQMVHYSHGDDVRPVQYYTPFILFLTLVTILIIMLLLRKRGLVTSGVLFLFWFLFAIGTGASYYTMLQRAFNNSLQYDEALNNLDFVMSMIYFPLSFVQFILNCFADQPSPNKVDNDLCPEVRASFISRVTFWWFNPMIIMGYKKPLSMEKMWKLSEENLTRSLQARLDKYWLPLVRKYTSLCKQMKQVCSRRYSTPHADLSVTVKPSDCEDIMSKLSILKPIIKTFWRSFLYSAIMKLIASVITFANPLILDKLIDFIGSNDPYWKGLCFAAGMFLASMMESFFSNQYEYGVYTIAMHMRSCLTSVLYRKALVLSTTAKKNFTVGEIVNLMSVDTQRIMDYIQLVNLLWAAPLQIAIAIYMLWQQLGIATLGGLTVLILMIPVNGTISVFVGKYQNYVMREKDTRTKLMNDILSGIKVLKLYAWELSFEKMVAYIRSKEVKSLRVQAILSGVINFVFACVPFLVSLASFATYVLISPDNVLDANKAFVSLSLFNILRIPTALLPMIVTYTAMFVVSIRRINKYLRSDELDPDAVTHDKSEEHPVVIKNGTFSWSEKESPVLTDVNFKAEEGSLTAVVGQIGCGKSSLISAFLGELIKVSGKINIKGSTAYVPQQAWIQNKTLKDNILFIKPYMEKKYKAIIEACALKSDLEILPGGDLTEIGEKGINVSGGQKQRISLARAVYDDADVYLLDDPLSAVDAHVGKHIFDKVIGPQGMLKRKTRVLVTHRISVLPEVDTIYVMKDGKITESGSYKELLNKKGAFAEFLIQYLQESTAEGEKISPDELRLMEEIAATVGAPPEIAKQLSCMNETESDGDTEQSNQTRTLSFALTESIKMSDGNIHKRAKSEMDVNIEEMQKMLRKKSTSVNKLAGTKLIEKEFAEVGSVKWSVYFQYLRAFGFWGCIIGIFGYGAAEALSLGANLWLSAWSNDSLDPASVGDTKLRDLRLGVYGGLGIADVVFTLLAAITVNLSCLRAAKTVHNNMLSRILRAPMSFFDTTPLGRILNRFSKDIDTADITIQQNFRLLIIMTFATLASLIVIAMQTPIFIIAAIPLGVLYYFLQRFYIPTSRQLKRLESISRSPIYTHFSETVTGASSIRAYAAEHHFINHSYQLVDSNNSAYFPSLGASRWLTVRLEFIGYTIVFLSALFAVLFREDLSPGVAGLSVSYALEITGLLNMLVRATADLETNIVAVERCLEYTTTPMEAAWSIKEKKPPKTWPEKGVIQFQSYATRYREGLDLVLKDITCDITSTERIGIVGRTGAGKSSLTLALFRIIESARGKIVIDGRNVADMGLHDLRSHLTIIPQDPVLFMGTLRMNLDPFDSYSDKEVWESLELAHLKTFARSLEKGLQHDIAEGGENLSIGQRQLVCLARALLRKTKILILDEATAACDVETDELIQSTIRTAFSDSTVITIAHRLNTIMDYDRVMVLSDGEIAELDTPKALLENENSIFYSMAKDAGLI